MNMRKKFLATAAGIAITASTALTGAAQTATDDSSVTIGSGAFTVSFSASDFANLPYSLSDQYARGGQINVLVSDQTGDAGGWQINLSLTDFVGQSRQAITPILSENLEIKSATVTIAADNSQAISGPNMTPVYGEADPQLVWTAAPGYGQGAYNLNMVGDLLVPGRTVAQTYTSTGTLTVVTGP